ncbi:MAG: hypothetical protein EHM48_00140 [Planctomycetaceae bacterium]|nr:MAG: hypothetical protein EHM48_00140 [Planctomycetaceae bacterium]
MNDDVPNDIKIAIITQERMGAVQQIYRMGISIKARNIAGYTEQETAPLTAELERLIKIVDAFDLELKALDVPGE